MALAGHMPGMGKFPWFVSGAAGMGHLALEMPGEHLAHTFQEQNLKRFELISTYNRTAFEFLQEVKSFPSQL